MALNVPALVALGAGTGFLALATYFWRRSNALYNLLVEGANRFEELRQRLQLMEREQAGLAQRAAQHLAAEAQARQQLTDLAGKYAGLQQLLETKELEANHRLRNLDLQKNHLLKQNDALTEKAARLEESLMTFESRAQQAESKVERAHRHAQDQASEHVQSKLQKLEAAAAAAKHQAQEAERKLARYQQHLKDLSPQDVQNMRRKLPQYERLYQSMKSLRDMVDERNKNWEVALRKLSEWILNESSVAKAHKAAIPTSIGPLVGEALAAIGSGLVEVSEASAHEEQLIQEHLEGSSAAVDTDAAH